MYCASHSPWPSYDGYTVYIALRDLLRLERIHRSRQELHSTIMKT